MKSRDQQLLEEAYQSIYEDKVANSNTEVEPGWDVIPKSEYNNPCICGSEKPFNECCGAGYTQVGSTVYIMDEHECHWLDFSGLKEPYKTNWNAIKNKCGVVVGQKTISSASMLSFDYSEDSESTEIVYGIKRPNGKIYAIPHELIDSEIPEKAAKPYQQELNMRDIENRLPELEGILTFNSK